MADIFIELLDYRWYSRKTQMLRNLGFFFVGKSWYDYSQHHQLRIFGTIIHTLSATYFTFTDDCIENQLEIGFIDVTLYGSQRYLLHSA